jgi:hypothetical protein
MAAAHPAPTPATADLEAFAKADALEERDAAHYRSVVGGLQWAATCTKPEVAYAVSVLQRHMAVPTASHMAAAKRVLRYLRGHPEGLTYARGARDVQPELTGFADASYANDPATRRSHTGYVFMLGGAAVAWRSKRQSCVTLSTTEAEYVALCHAAVTAHILQLTLAFMGCGQSGPVPVFEDNQAARSLASGEGVSSRTKHIDVKYHYVREAVTRGVIAVMGVGTAEQRADVLTKALHPPQFRVHAAALLGRQG